MNIRTIVSRRELLSLVAALSIAAPAVGQPATASESVVKVFADHYEAGGKRFANLDALSAWVDATAARTLVFHSCMSTPRKPLVDALERFHNVYLDVRWSKAGEPGCPAAATPQ